MSLRTRPGTRCQARHAAHRITCAAADYAPRQELGAADPSLTTQALTANEPQRGLLQKQPTMSPFLAPNSPDPAAGGSTGLTRNTGDRPRRGDLRYLW